jgi:hypothetical protein
VKPRLFIGNFDFEHRLAEPNRETPAKLQQLNAEMATAWLSIARDGDWIWTPFPINIAFFHEAVQQGLPNVIPVNSFSEVPRDVECVPWGWSTEIRTLVKRYGWSANAPSEAAVRRANSRATSDELERLWNVGLDQSRRIESLEQVNAAIYALRRSADRWVVKAEYGMSARERILGCGAMTISDENWIRRRLTAQRVVFFEPWVDRIGEVGIQIDIPENGEPQFIGLTPMLVDGRGQYVGSWFAFHDERFAVERAFWPNAMSVAMQAATHLQSLGYFGPVGIDVMVYRDESGAQRVRPLQDINARWTMGRLALGWRRLLKPGDEGCWRHTSTSDSTELPEFQPTRMISTSPDLVGNTQCHHLSRILIQLTENK